MSPILTAEDVVKRIAAECAFVDQRGAVGIRLKPAAAIVRQSGRLSASRRKVAETAAAALNPALGSIRLRPRWSARVAPR